MIPILKQKLERARMRPRRKKVDGLIYRERDIEKKRERKNYNIKTKTAISIKKN